MRPTTAVRPRLLPFAALACAFTAAWAAAPSTFTYSARDNVATHVFVASEARAVDGFSDSLPVSVSGGQNPQYSIDGGPFTAVPGSIRPGQRLAVRHVSSSNPTTRLETTVRVGDAGVLFASTTGGADRTPNGFAFAGKGNVAPGAAVISDPVTPQGYNTATTIAVSGGGEYRIGSGAFTGSAGTLAPGQAVTVRHTASSARNAYTRTTLTVGGIAATFTSRTQAPLAASDTPDADGDGVPDTADACPNTPAGASVEPNGCPVAPPRFALNVARAGSGMGTVTSTPAGIACGDDCAESYDRNTAVDLAVAPASGSRFAGWSGACTGTAACKVTMDAAKSVTATFDAVPKYTLAVTTAGAGKGAVTSDPAGIACGTDCTENFLENTVVSLTARPDDASTFTGWSGACTGATDCSVTMAQAKTVTATFGVAPVTTAADYLTDSSRTADGTDPDTVINPILSAARPNGDSTPVPGANADNKTLITASVFVPAHTASQTFPVVLHSHGWGGTKEAVPRSTGLPTVLANEGYIVVSFDERGWGNSEGEVRVMDPAYEAQDAKAVIDWIVAEQKAGRLPVKMDGPNDPRLGTYGGSYGGGFQLNLAAEDPRVDALAPDITWNDLRYSLIPNGLIKSAWGNLLCAAGTARPNRDEFLIKGCAALPGASDSFRTKEGIETVVPGFHDFVYSHGMVYYAEKGTSPVVGSPYKRKMPPVLLTQGMRDNLFNGLEALRNYKFLSTISPDVRLLTHQSGHLNPTVGQASGPQTCGPITLTNSAASATRQWFKRWLKDDPTALDTLPRVCISLENGKSVVLDSVPEGGVLFTKNVGSVSVTTASAPPPTNAQFVSIGTIDKDGQVLAGIPRLKGVTVKCPVPSPGVCPPANPASEPIALVGIGLKRGSTITLIDEQLTPVRSQGSPYANVDLPMIGEVLNKGDEVGLMLYTVHGQYKVQAASSGGTAAPAAGPNDQYAIGMAGVELPIFTPAAGSLRQ